jgi:hypothetical protein
MPFMKLKEALFKIQNGGEIQERFRFWLIVIAFSNRFT